MATHAPSEPASTAPSFILEVSQTTADGPSETLPPSSQVQSSAASAHLDRPHLPAPNFSTLSASARTSYTRVDLSTMDIDATARDEGGQDQVDTTDPAQDQPAEESVPPGMPQVSLTFLLVSGRRRTMSFEQEMTIGRVKELVWNAWPNEWQDERPPAPSYLRILYLGKILQDDDTLTKVGFPSYTPSSQPGSNAVEASRPPTPPPSTIVHLSIRAYAPPAQEAPKKKSRRQRGSQATGGDERPADAEERVAGCCGGCVIC